jgi:hypothetical protein
MLSRALPSPRKLAAVVLTLSNKTGYTDDEETAFRHVRHYLGSHDTFALIPEDHPAIYPGFRPKRFPRRFFGSPRAHGRLLLSERFYRAFLDYEFILVHHLDALVFRDDLLTWCGAGYDYIGAPWLISPDTPHITESKVGNGGFSLRRVRAFLNVIRSRRHFVDPDEYWRAYCARTGRFAQLVNRPRKFLKRYGIFNDVGWHIRWALHGDVHEDRFWAEHAAHYDPAFRIAPVATALRFAFEAEPRRSFERIGRRLPFGCHRWQRFDRAFYEPFLLKNGPGSEVRVRTTREARREWNDEAAATQDYSPASGLTAGIGQ